MPFSCTGPQPEEKSQIGIAGGPGSVAHGLAEAGTCLGLGRMRSVVPAAKPRAPVVPMGSRHGALGGAELLALLTGLQPCLAA